jgi:hypothetical protein
LVSEPTSVLRRLLPASHSIRHQPELDHTDNKNGSFKICPVQRLGRQSTVMGHFMVTLPVVCRRESIHSYVPFFQELAFRPANCTTLATVIIVNII